MCGVFSGMLAHRNALDLLNGRHAAGESRPIPPSFNILTATRSCSTPVGARAHPSLKLRGSIIINLGLVFLGMNGGQRRFSTPVCLFPFNSFILVFCFLFVSGRSPSKFRAPHIHPSFPPIKCIVLTASHIIIHITFRRQPLITTMLLLQRLALCTPQNSCALSVLMCME